MKLTAYDLAHNKQEYLSQFFIDCLSATVPQASWHARSLILKNDDGEYIASRTADAWAIWQRAAKWGAS